MVSLLAHMLRCWLPLLLSHRSRNSTCQNQPQLLYLLRHFHFPLLPHPPLPLLAAVCRQTQLRCSPSRTHASVSAQNAGRKATQLRCADRLRSVLSAKGTTTNPLAYYRLPNASVCYARLTNIPSPVADDLNRNSFAPMVLCRRSSSSNDNQNRAKLNSGTRRSTHPLPINPKSSSGRMHMVRLLQTQAGAVLVANPSIATTATRNVVRS